MGGGEVWNKTWIFLLNNFLSHKEADKYIKPFLNIENDKHFNRKSRIYKILSQSAKKKSNLDDFTSSEHSKNISQNSKKSGSAA